MTIQLSVSVWTVICFILLMLILHNLLFKPVLEVMDKRRERIECARAKKAEQERLLLEQEAAFVEAQAAARDAQKKKIKEEIEAIRLDSKRAIEVASEKRIEELDDCRAKTNIEHTVILDTLSENTTELAALFADSLTKE